jgi:hypothetical protein
MKLKSDKYKKARGGGSKLLEISCGECGSFVCNYQKDGSGNLRRMYVDRISDAKVSLLEKSLKCENGHLLGMAIIYKKEKRPAFRLLADSVKKKIVK